MGLMWLRSWIGRYWVRMSHTVSGVELMVVRVVARALAGGHHLEPAGAGPVHLLADQRRLVAPGERVDDARLARAAREQRPRQGVGLDVDHDDVLAVPDRGQGELDAGRGVAGGLDDEVDSGVPDDGERIVGDEGRAGLQGLAQGRGGELLLRPADAGEPLAGARRHQVGEACEVHARRQAHLGEEHGAELAGPDLADANGPIRGGELLQQARERHGPSSVSDPPGPTP